MTASTFPALLEAFFTDRLVRQRRASPHTIGGYRDTFRLLLGFARQRLRKEPSGLTIADLDAPLIGAFLDHLEKDRGNSARTRNVRLAAIHSFFQYLALEEPGHSAVIQRVLAMPSKRFDRRLVGFLTRPEMEALLAAPDRHTWSGRRDHTLLLVAMQTGLRVSELSGQRTKGAMHPATQGRGRRTAQLAARARRVVVRPSIPERPRWRVQSRRGRVSVDQTLGCRP